MSLRLPDKKKGPGHVMNGRPARLVLIGLFMAVGAGLPSPPLPAQDPPGEMTDGKLLYELHCLRCHGAEGRGDGPRAKELLIPPANFHSPLVKMKSDEQLLTTIEFGRVLTPMHAWRGRLTEEEMQAVVAYLRRLAERGH